MSGIGYPFVTWLTCRYCCLIQSAAHANDPIDLSVSQRVIGRRRQLVGIHPPRFRGC